MALQSGSQTMRIVLIDNYDSFTYNLVQAFGQLGAQVEVLRNDSFKLADISRHEPTHIVISPGPCTPKESGLSNDVIRQFIGVVPILGVCLGHQCLAHVFGGKVVRAKRLMHGKTSSIRHDGQTIFKGMPNPFKAMRYNSLLVSPKSVPDCFEVSARSEKGEVMAIRHKELAAEGVQFHPESFMTDNGLRLLRNFIAIR
jgi:anthranilate synthase/aminodeoxychorismate synthase-like glutamine amidotransferase